MVSMAEATRKAAVLIEGLPFLKQFHHRYMVVKLGGEAITDPEVRDALLTDLVYLEQVGIRPVLVHGGGVSITQAMDAADLEVRWHEGRRVTDAAAMAIVEREVEKLNRMLVDRLFELGGAAVGLMPDRHPVVRGAIMDPNLGLVGSPNDIDATRVVRYGSRGLIPVVPPLSISPDGIVMNTNADDIALAIARGLHASKLIFGSSIPGVLRDPNDPESRIASLTPTEVLQLRDEGVISGGMIPKLESCLEALTAGVRKIHIVSASLPHALLLEIFTRDGVGTEIVAEQPGLID
jgi:acetylglutamate kinase